MRYELYTTIFRNPKEGYDQDGRDGGLKRREGEGKKNNRTRVLPRHYDKVEDPFTSRAHTRETSSLNDQTSPGSPTTILYARKREKGKGTQLRHHGRKRYHILLVGWLARMRMQGRKEGRKEKGCIAKNKKEALGGGFAPCTQVPSRLFGHAFPNLLYWLWSFLSQGCFFLLPFIYARGQGSF